MDNIDKIREILTSGEWTEAEKAVVKWQFRLTGDFFKALWEAICRADEDNLERLSRGFPTEVEGYLAWHRGDLGPRLRKAGLHI
jgi:hypothetical protein